MSTATRHLMAADSRQLGQGWHPVQAGPAPHPALSSPEAAPSPGHSLSEHTQADFATLTVHFSYWEVPTHKAHGQH